MAPVKAAGARKSAGRTTAPKAAAVPPLPPITVAKLEETGRLLERVVSSNQALFVQKGQDYRDIHRAGSSRPLSPVEAAQVAAVLADQENAVATAQEVQEGTLRAYDEPDGREILLASGLGAAPAFLEAVREVVALVEMPSQDFEDACDADTLDQAIATRALELRKLELPDARARASRAFAHYAAAAGFEPGEAWRLPAQAVWQALAGAMNDLKGASLSSQLIDSAASTEDSPATTSSTASAGATP